MRLHHRAGGEKRFDAHPRVRNVDPIERASHAFVVDQPERRFQKAPASIVDRNVRTQRKLHRGQHARVSAIVVDVQFDVAMRT